MAFDHTDTHLLEQKVDIRLIQVELPTTYELAINLKTAHAMGIKIPDSVMVRATHVIK